MTKYVSLVTQRLGNFMVGQPEHISRDSNEKADALTALRPYQYKKQCPARLLLARVVNYYQPGKRNRRSISLLDDSNSPLFELGGITGEQGRGPQDPGPGGSVLTLERSAIQTVSGRALP